ncbi:MAG: thiamine diphosphokinase [Peptoniphilaceae bacterium]|nr:thiamine diphosphokinase [Peptoniphilaceae bacterium]MDD7383105.1 thiamine diphosphokinase [Peptoniphilaceae bacterium]MDY3737540.1 thiamine diphosphokinase [Peptoniphilaceae bacterium]
MKRAYIVAAGDFDNKNIHPKKNDIVIAADAGFYYLKKIGITPDYVIGDFDSGDEPDFNNKIKLKREKDRTDTYEAMKLAEEKHANEIFIYAALGGRVSHSIANIISLVEFTLKGIKTKIISNDKIIFAINKNIKIENPQKGYYSIFSFTDKCEGITLKGFKYELENFTLKNTDALGVSNEINENKNYIEINLKSGVLLVVYEKK